MLPQHSPVKQDHVAQQVVQQFRIFAELQGLLDLDQQFMESLGPVAQHVHEHKAHCELQQSVHYLKWSIEHLDDLSQDQGLKNDRSH